MTWTLLIVAITGTFSASIHTAQIPMASKEACVKAAGSIAEKSTGIGFICVSSETGETFKVEK